MVRLLVSWSVNLIYPQKRVQNFRSVWSKVERFGSSLVKSLEQAKESFRRPAMVDILTLSILCALGLVNPQIFFLKVNAIDIVGLPGCCSCGPPGLRAVGQQRYNVSFHSLRMYSGSLIHVHCRSYFIGTSGHRFKLGRHVTLPFVKIHEMFRECS